ncbi:phosphodiester glycosidase family protein [Treponema primitia]|uniref:phosphodiester glycosidase family protein n=1 Tax=Treponema primitia TaxID=88058 RepID=UPI0002554F19|nr:phosphodiester glycosidase family protein [Treponema primitia]
MRKTGHGKTLNSFFLLFLLLSVLLSCASLSPLADQPRTPPARTVTPDVLLPAWKPFAPGIDYFEGRIGKPRLELWALRVDLGNPDLEFVVNSGEMVGVIPGTTITGFVRDYDCIAGINTNPFDPVSANVGEERTIVGISIAAGVLNAPAVPGYDALVLYTNGKAAIVSQAALTTPDELMDIRNAVGGFSEVLREGAVTEQTLARNGPRHPRSAAGISADGKTLYLLAIDGRRPGSAGATEEEIGIILKQLGADDGLNFDGGGSTALALRYPDGTVRAVNTPIHGMIPGKERAVATCLGIRVVE